MSDDQPPSRHVVGEWVRTQRVPPADKLALLLLFEHAGPQPDGSWACWVKYAQLGWEAGWSGADPFRKRVQSLEAAGLVRRAEQRYRQDGSKSTMLVHLLVPGAPIPPDGSGPIPAAGSTHPHSGVVEAPMRENGSTDVEPAKSRAGEQVDRSALTQDQRYVLDELGAVAGAKGKALDEAAALRACLDYSDRDHVREADRFRHWHLEGRGRARRPAKSLAAQWRTWLRSSDARSSGGAPAPGSGDGFAERTARRAAELARLEAEGES